ncbi:hypothetical protein B0T24DRAFT_679392 [Lasiosphaeria ovina]|uniref:Inner membrane assembly complex subunit 17 n=1 Tax=Lasiosphaeria ovina TaxID=92902 RepID=A0AAE0KDM3_9PEZI|nr:hypothetical protein B0T24DRAFT_679392 [Lasiosphaeria ovina]
MRASSPLSGTHSLRAQIQTRRYSTEQSSPPPPSRSPSGNFYKTFTRPVAKCLLLAMFVYQLAYWGWVKLEQDEITGERKEIALLEGQVRSLQEAKARKA